MYQQIRRLAMSVVLLTGSLFAYTHPAPGSWALEGDFLYLLPTVDHTFFVTTDSNPGTGISGTKENNDLGFSPGFRVGGVYAFCDCNREFQVYYTRLRTQNTKTVTGSLVIGASDSFNGSASSDLDFLYQRLDAVFAQQSWCCCGVDFNIVAGFEFDYARLKENYIFSGIPIGTVFGTALADVKSRTWGLGPQFGVEFSYNICQFSCIPGNFSIASAASGSILASKTSASSSIVGDGVTVLDIKNQNIWRLVPALHARVGLNYETRCSCFGFSLEVGYEFNTYCRTLSRYIFSSNSTSVPTVEYCNVDLQGLYVDIGLTF